MGLCIWPGKKSPQCLEHFRADFRAYTPSPKFILSKIIGCRRAYEETRMSVVTRG